MDYIFPTMHSDEISSGRYRVVTASVAARSNTSPAHSLETQYRTGSFWEDEPGNYITGNRAEIDTFGDKQ